ncbi:M20 family peptidase [Neobacillus notoginsengisoli]|uniref:M20 family peptidase n=1 Tax=Neobacillus notoginsengisoli TaxID=1578198 RepID=A0A417YRW1_9BACI|nr:M20 family metallopeptidase [Neobacillus notoginsengisoli]RHW38038.1 M20 family peptidase [Neobacillus notoginsengisoli]
MSKILDYLKENQLSMTETLLALTRAESPSYSKIDVDYCGEVLRNEYTRLVGGNVDVIEKEEVGNQYKFSFGPDNGLKQVLIIGHMDTVWDVGARPIRQDGDILYGPGVFDMKGGLTITLWALKAIKETGAFLDRKITFLVTSDEEIGSSHSKELIEEEAVRSSVVFVPESSIGPDGAVKTERKGAGQFLLRIEGITAHAGINAWDGASATEELAYQILDLKKLADRGEGISVNVGVVQGGTRANVIAKEATAEIDVRITKKSQAKNLLDKILNRPTFVKGTKVHVEGVLERYPLERNEHVIELYEQLKEIANAHGYALGEGSSGGASDGNFTAGLGIPTIDGLGPIGDGAHAETEHVLLSNLPNRAALLAEIILKNAGNPKEEELYVHDGSNSQSV